MTNTNDISELEQQCLPEMPEHHKQVIKFQSMLQKLFQEGVALSPNTRYNPFIFSCANPGEKRPRIYAYLSLDAFLGFMVHLFTVATVSNTELENEEDAASYHLAQANNSFATKATDGFLQYLNLERVRSLFLAMTYDGQRVWHDCSIVPINQLSNNPNMLTKTIMTATSKPNTKNSFNQFLFCPDWTKHVFAVAQIAASFANDVFTLGTTPGLMPVELWKEILGNNFDMQNKADQILYPEFTDIERKNLMKQVHTHFFEMQVSNGRFGQPMSDSQLEAISPFLYTSQGACRDPKDESSQEPVIYGPFCVNLPKANDAVQPPAYKTISQLHDELRKKSPGAAKLVDYWIPHLPTLIKQEKHDSNFSSSLPPTKKEVLLLVTSTLKGLYYGHADSPKEVPVDMEE